jgi:hypothetical protein
VGLSPSFHFNGGRVDVGNHRGGRGLSSWASVAVASQWRPNLVLLAGLIAMVVSGVVGSYSGGRGVSERGASGGGRLDPVFGSWLHRHDGQWRREVCGSVTCEFGDSLGGDAVRRR